MKITLHLERANDIPLTEWETFLSQARRMGADDFTPVSEQYEDEDPYSPVGYSIEVERTGTTTPPEKVLLPTQFLHDLRYVAASVAGSNGDRISAELEELAKGAVEQLDKYFRNLAIGPDMLDPPAED